MKLFANITFATAIAIHTVSCATVAPSLALTVETSNEAQPGPMLFAAQTEPLSAYELSRMPEESKTQKEEKDNIITILDYLADSGESLADQTTELVVSAVDMVNPWSDGPQKDTEFARTTYGE